MHHRVPGVSGGSGVGNMFTGIVEEVGSIHVPNTGHGDGIEVCRRVWRMFGSATASPSTGVCLTVTRFSDESFPRT